MQLRVRAANDRSKLWNKAEETKHVKQGQRFVWGFLMLPSMRVKLFQTV